MTRKIWTDKIWEVGVARTSHNLLLRFEEWVFFKVVNMCILSSTLLRMSESSSTLSTACRTGLFVLVVFEAE